MKKFIMSSVALAAVAVAAPAFAEESAQNHDVTITIEGSTPAKCNINSDDTTVHLEGYDLTNDQGRVRANVANKVANALNGLNLRAWCTGGNNGVVASRSALTTGDGNATDSGFNQAIVYDLDLNIDGATRNGAAFFEGTSDGPGNGPGIGAGSGIVVPEFGPTGQGAKLTFVQEPGSTVSASTNGQSGAETDRAAFNGTESNARLVAGSYTGTVTVTLTPGA